jgi:hypothetical protein
MAQDAKDENVARILTSLDRQLSRGQLLKAAGIAVAAAAVPGAASAQTGVPGTPMPPTGSYSFPFYPQVSGRYTPETVPTILNIAQTMEHLATTLVNAGVMNATALGISGLSLQSLQAALAEEVYHVQFLAAMGATPLTTTFTLPDPALLTNATVFFRTLELFESVCTAAYLTANREFAELGQPLLAKFAMQAGVVEGEHRVAARTALAMLSQPTPGPTPAGPAANAGATPWTGAPGTAAPPVANPVPPNNKAFATDYFVSMTDAAALIRSLGFIGGTGTPVVFPGTATALANSGAPGVAVMQQLPNNATTSATAAVVIAALTSVGVTNGVVARGTGSGTS